MLCTAPLSLALCIFQSCRQADSPVGADATVPSPASSSTALTQPARPWDTGSGFGGAYSSYGGAGSSYAGGGAYGGYSSSPYGSSAYSRPAGDLGQRQQIACDLASLL